MRSVLGRAIVVASVATVLLAQAAAAREYEFVANDGTRCAVDTSRSSTAQPDGNWTIANGAVLSCNAAVHLVHLASRLERAVPAETFEFPGYSCNLIGDPNAAPCETFPVSSGGSIADQPTSLYTQVTDVSIFLAPSEPRSGARWVSVPTHLARAVRPAVLMPSQYYCRAGTGQLSCEFGEDFVPR